MKLPFITDRAIRLYQDEAGAINMNEARRRMKTLGGRFAMLDAAISAKLEMNDPKHVIVTAYPQLKMTASGTCGPGNYGMNVSTFLSVVTTEKPGNVTPTDAGKIVDELNLTIKNNAVKYRWSFVDAHVSQFRGHSFCDYDPKPTGVHKSTERHGHPASAARPCRRKLGSVRSDKGLSSVRTSDALGPDVRRCAPLAYYFKGQAEDEPVKQDDIGIYQAMRALGGPMHPNAEGHAVVADALLKKAVEVEFLDGVPPKTWSPARRSWQTSQ